MKRYSTYPERFTASIRILSDTKKKKMVESLNYTLLSRDLSQKFPIKYIEGCGSNATEGEQVQGRITPARHYKRNKSRTRKQETS